MSWFDRIVIPFACYGLYHMVIENTWMPPIMRMVMGSLMAIAILSTLKEHVAQGGTP